MTIESLRESLLDTADLIHPNLQSLNNPYISIEDMVDYIIYEGIKYAYDNYAVKKSIRQHMIDRSMDTDADRRRFSRQIQYAQYYRDIQNEQIGEKGFYSEELSAKDMDEFSNRMSGYEINAMNFQELCNMLNIPLLEKIIGHKISSSKKVSNTRFVELMNQYDSYVRGIMKDMDTPEKIVYNTELFFVLEWKYNVEIIYDIVLEAEKLGYPEFKPEASIWIFGTVNIPPTTEWFDNSINTECRMVFKRTDFIPMIFKFDSEEHIMFENTCAELYRIREVIRMMPKRKTVTELVSTTTMEDRAAFLKERQWIWDRYHVEKDWTPERIQYARKIYDAMYQIHENPSIK